MHPALRPVATILFYVALLCVLPVLGVVAVALVDCLLNRVEA